MKLDKRIINGKRPLTCFDIEEAEKYIGKLCYMCDEYDQFHELNLIEPTILKGVEDCEIPFHYGKACQAEFCLPCEWVKKEKQYRPYTLEEFCDKFHFGYGIILRPKDLRSMELHVVYNGYKVLTASNKTEFYLGPAIFTLSELFEGYERFENGRWVPCGVEVEE